MGLGSSIWEGGVEKEWRKGWLPWGAVPSLSRSAEFRQEIVVDSLAQQWVCVVIGGRLQEVRSGHGIAEMLALWVS